ncbi:hypothetical protein E2C01_011669 [Portunus trituberculatus]|uniref:Uncharacterized protein n=1 Tax=Portunus trituberculatus TaxID=210409 RepID=A0A5B7DC33_PORTR|nr:hypothetical protein [Portunus trituberculatus]
MPALSRPSKPQTSPCSNINEPSPLPFLTPAFAYGRSGLLANIREQRQQPNSAMTRTWPRW